MSKVRFGFWPRKWRIAISGLLVEPLDNYAEVLQSILEHKRTFAGWIYPPLEPTWSSKAFGQPGPLMPATSYGLPSTHELTLGYDDDAFAEFAIALIGLLDGMQLEREGWSHFYKSATEPGKLVDYHCTNASEITKALEMGTRRWRSLDQDCQKWMFGVIHWYCFTAAYEHDFERFGGLYTVLDTLYRVHVQTGGRLASSHAERAVVLAETHGIPVPDWVAINNKASRLSNLRNEFFHEGRYAGEPIGFAFPKDNITLDLAAFVTRVILGTLAVDCAYVRTAATTRQMHGLDVR